MGKPKNKKKEQDDISDNEVDSTALDMAPTNDDQGISAPAKGKKKDKRKKKKDDDWEDDVAKELEQMSLETNKGVKEEEVEDIPQPVKKTKKKKRKDQEEDEEDEDVPKTSKPTFQMLMMEGDDDDDDVNEEENEQESESKPSEIVLENVKEAAGGKKKDKKGKKKEKAKTKEEEDIDAILAALDAPTEKKKGKKGKQAEESKEPSPEQEVPGPDKAVAPEEGEVKENGNEPNLAKEVKEGGEEMEEDGEDEGGSTVKTAAQKRKEKKEREKQKKLKEKQKGKKQAEKAVEGEGEGQGAQTEGAAEAGKEDAAAKPQDEEGEEEETTSKKKKKKGEKEEKKEKKPKKQVAAILELQKRLKEEQERLEREEQERIAKEEEEQRLAEEKKRLEEERKLRKKEKEKARKERMRLEGKPMTEKQKQEQRRAMQLLETMKEQGLEVPSKEDAPKKKKPMYIDKRKKKQQQQTEERTPSPTDEKTAALEEAAKKEEEEASKEEARADENEEEEDEDEDEVKDSWDLIDEDEKEAEEKPTIQKAKVAAPATKASETKKDEESEEDDEDDDDDEDEDDESEEEEESGDDERPLEERVREKLQKYHEEAEKKRTTDVLRAPVVCVLGHVDTGKTKILDKLRQTNVQNAEAGGITQQIGATNVPKEEILKKTSMCKEFTKKELKLPGLLIIDTPGHESFSNMRSRGSSLCDIAILVIDIMHSLEPQTKESIGLLKQRKTPFVVALNKIDRLYQWQTNPKLDVASVIKKQSPNTKAEFDERANKVIVELAELGLNAALYYENKNPKEYISLVPTSAHTGDGMGNLVALICELTQTMMAKRVSYSEELQASVMEVKNLQGLGTTIDVILVNGYLKLGDNIVVAGTEGPITTTIKGLLQPQPMRELRVKSQYVRQTEVRAAQGVKIVAKDLEKALAGLPLYVPRNADEAEFYRMELEKTLDQVLKSFEGKDKGVYVQASTLGSLEALLNFLQTSKIPYSGINLGDVHKKDVTRACAMLEHDKMYAVILAFDVKVEREAQELADKEGVIIFTADIIYTLFDRFMEHVDRLKKERQAEFKHQAVYPCKMKILQQHIFKTRDPIVCGVTVEAGSVVEGTPVCVPSKEFLDIGRVVSIESNNKPVDRATAGMEVCIKIEALPGEAPKMIGRHFESTDLLVSKISRQSIDVMKNYFRDEMTKQDWHLMVELKALFQII